MWFDNGMNHTATTATRKLAKLNAQMGGTYRQIAGYKAIRAVAVEYGMEYEAERAFRSIVEMENEIDCLIEQAIEAGFVPEDFESGVELDYGVQA